jgi:hypothetical protein
MLLARIYESAPLACPRCGADMRIIAFVTDGVSVRSILTHIGEPTDPPRIAPARPCAAPQRCAILLRLSTGPNPPWFGRSLLPQLTLLRLGTSPSHPWLGRSLLDHSSPLLRLGTGLGLLSKPLIALQFTRRDPV